MSKNQKKEKTDTTSAPNGRISAREFVARAIKNLRQAPYKGIHTVYSGFNKEFKNYFDGASPVDATKALVAEGFIEMRPVRGGMLIYLAGEMPQYIPGEKRERQPKESATLSKILK